MNHAVFKGHVEVAEMLIQNYANVNAEDYKRLTPLHNAIKKGNVKIARLLVENNACINLKNKDGKTPLNIAYDIGWSDEKIEEIFYIGLPSEEPGNENSSSSTS